MNAVRMSHYPPDRHFLETCDELGLYVIDELTGWQAKYDTEVGAPLVKELVRRDVNHPSVVFWANGNEGGFNFDLDDDYAPEDPQGRTVIHPWDAFNGIDTLHYPAVRLLRAEVPARPRPRDAHRVHARALRRRARRRPARQLGADRQQPARGRRVPVGVRRRGPRARATATAPSTPSATTAPTASSARTARRKRASSRSRRCGRRWRSRDAAAADVRRPPAGPQRLLVHRPEGLCVHLAVGRSSPAPARHRRGAHGEQGGPRDGVQPCHHAAAARWTSALPVRLASSSTRCRSPPPTRPGGTSTPGAGCCGNRPTSRARSSPEPAPRPRRATRPTRSSSSTAGANGTPFDRARRDDSSGVTVGGAPVSFANGPRAVTGRRPR